jgi:hypothetical protein
MRYSSTFSVLSAALIAFTAVGAHAQGKTTGDGDFRFRVFQTSEILPPEAREALPRAHGGFAVDRREGKGEAYFALPGAGIIQISPDLRSTRLIPTPDEVKNTNLHNTAIWYDTEGTPFLSLPANDAGKVFTTTLDGNLVHTLEQPAPDFSFDEPVVNEYFAKNGKLVPTDVVYLNGLLYITTGYSALDYVLTAYVGSTDPMRARWHDLAFGGKGDQPGQFGTGHGITISPDMRRIHVADRPNSEVDGFTRFGHYRETLKLPEGSFPCDIDFAGGYTVVGCLHGPDRSKGAPIYLLKDGELISTLMPKEDLGLEKFTHVHNATLRILNGRVYILAQAWNPGDFVILEHVGR